MDGRAVGVNTHILPRRTGRSFTGEMVNHTKREKLRK